MRPAQYTFVAQDLAAICGYQTTADAGDLNINGTYVDGQALGVGVDRAFMPGGFARAVTINSSGDVSTVNFTIYGRTPYSVSAAETVSGPNASVVYTATQFTEVTRVRADAAVGSNTRVGIAGNGTSKPYQIDIFQNPVNIGVGASITAGSLAYSLQETDTDLNTYLRAGGAVSAIVWKNIGGISGLTGSTIDNVNAAHGWLRFTVSGATVSGAGTLTIAQVGGGSNG